MTRLAGRRCLVTGAARGIGRAVAEKMVEHGARVAVADIDIGTAREVAGKLGSAGLAIELDVTDAAAWTRAVVAADEAFGGLDVLVNNAGIIIMGSVESLDEADWDRTMDVDLKSVFLGCRAALPVLARCAPASIVNMSSISGLIAGHNMAAYNAAKAGVHLLTKSVALHAARRSYGVRCNSVHPAFVDTGMVDGLAKGADAGEIRAKLAAQVPLGRIGTVDDVAWAVIYLASEESAFMTGAEIKLDGGLSAM
jgi:NAD(P)-dependent dehydrogenase (short-subunit alcohol dehydrogenase family)